jgi:hypothetical protein
MEYFAALGVLNSTVSLETNGGIFWNNSAGYVYYGGTGVKINNGTQTAYGNTFGSGDTIGIAFDADAGKIWFAKNNTWQASGDPVAGTNAAFTSIPTGSYRPAHGIYRDASTRKATFNFGQKPFRYAPPEGFKTLCLANLPRPTEAAVRPDNYVGIVTYTGSGSARDINIGFEPGLVWIKNRDVTDHYALFDSIRGPLQYVSSNRTNASAELANTLTSFKDDGFTLGSANLINYSGQNYVAWTWKAGGAAVSNTDGNVTSTISVNTEAGFSVVSYASSTTTKPLNVGHGLGKKPEFILTKNRDLDASWGGYHSSTGATKSMFINTTGSGTVSIDYWNNTEPTDSVFTVYDSNSTHSYGTTNGFIAYCWTSIEGYSKFGSYTANGNADGPFIYCGFRPSLVWLKKTTSTSNWFAYDTSRNPYNALGNKLYLENSINENGEDGGSTTSNIIDALSNGFKLRSANGTNNSGTYLFCAWAEAPTNNLFGGQANAR